jgi:hypothetical protein
MWWNVEWRDVPICRPFQSLFIFCLFVCVFLFRLSKSTKAYVALSQREDTKVVNGSFVDM